MDFITEFINANPWVIYAVVGVIALIPFGFGFAKGFRKLHWGCWIWGGTAVGYYFLRNFLLGFEPVQNILASMEGLDPVVVSSAFDIVLALALVLAVMIVVGLFGVIVRPRTKELTDYEKEVEEYDDDKKWEDLDEDEIRQKKLQKGKPCFFNRLIGGIFNLVNFAVVVVAIVAVVALVLKITPLATGVLQPVFENEFFAMIWDFIYVYTLDLLIIGFIIALGYSGYKAGVACGAYALLAPVGGLAVGIFSFWLPFSPLVLGGPLEFLDFFAAAIMNALPEMIPVNIAVIIARLAIGLIVCILLGIVYKLITMGIKALVNKSLRKPFWCFIDGIIGTLVRLVLSVVIVAVFAMLAYTLHYFAVIDVSALTSVESPLFGGLFKIFELYLAPTFQSIIG